MKDNVLRWLRLSAVLMLAMPVFASSPAVAQGNCRTFTETGKTVCDKFLTYWTGNGGLAQQGFPITDVRSEASTTDGKIYTVQYFERSVFELHPEFAGTANEVLLQLLGVSYYAKNYPTGAPNQTANAEAGSQLFTETGHKLGGTFQKYWASHGGLRQQGFPISDEFLEVNKLDGKPYKVQYFERAVFEFHPEFAGTANEVLLSQLGTFALQAGTVTPTPVGAQPTPTTPVAGPTNTPVAPPPGGCADGVPAAKSGTITPLCGPVGTVYRITANGFTPGERISYWDTLPTGEVYGTPRPLDFGNHPGSFTDAIDTSFFDILGDDAYGIWAATYQGESSGHQTIVYYKVTRADNAPVPPTATPMPAGGCDLNGTKDAVVAPTTAKAGTPVRVTVSGFQGGENAGYWLTDPTGAVYGTQSQLEIPSSGGGTLTLNTAGLPVGRWALTIHGTSSNHESVGVFCITP